MQAVIFVVVVGCNLYSGVVGGVRRLCGGRRGSYVDLDDSLFTQLSAITSHLSSGGMDITRRSPRVSVPAAHSFQEAVTDGSSDSYELGSP